ncbi:hypothetical protein KSP40_PGU020975 [Platanthera guangdongensis]|uniref:Uncharacterized protein n=1 Tax=Platanthera guangdongensis TaxID=2320717 RepID=A0ABR2M264_9ASPA
MASRTVTGERILASRIGGQGLVKEVAGRTRRPRYSGAKGVGTLRMRYSEELSRSLAEASNNGQELGKHSSRAAAAKNLESRRACGKERVVTLKSRSRRGVERELDRCTIPTKVLLQLATAFRIGGLRNRAGTFLYKDSLHRCDVPILALAGDRDLICPPEAVYETVKLIPASKVSYRVFGKPDGPHYAHYDLVGGRLKKIIDADFSEHFDLRKESGCILCSLVLATHSYIRAIEKKQLPTYMSAMSSESEWKAAKSPESIWKAVESPESPSREREREGCR